MGGRTTYRTLSPKRAPFQIGIDWWSHLQKVPRRGWISHTHPVWLWGCSPYKISSPGPVFLEPSDYYETPIDVILHFIRGVRLIGC
jgi:hypothetical protein